MKPEQLNFIRIGSRYSHFRKLGIGNKAALLNHAVKSDLPVPNAIVLPDGGWQRMIEDGIVDVAGEDVTVNSADEFLERFALSGLRKRVAVRSAFSAEDRPQESLAGFFKSVLNVPHDDPITLINTLVDVWQSGNLRAGDFRRDIMVMEMVDAQVAGVAFTQADYQDDLVNFTDGTADKLVSGDVAGESLTMPVLLGWEQSDFAPGWQRRLQNLLRGVRRSFVLKGSDWDIEWADDGTTCWLLQIRPITAPPRRNEAFTYANLKEILPDPPSPFMTSIVADASAGFFDWYRQFDRTLPTSRPMVEVFAGRPMFNLSLLTDMMRHWGLPSALVTNSIGGASEKDTVLKFGRFMRKSLVLLRLGFSQLTAVKSAREAAPGLLESARTSEDTFTALSDTFRDLFVAFVTEMFNLTQAMSGPLLLLRNNDAVGAASDETVTTEMFQQFSQLRLLVTQKPTLADALAKGVLPSEPDFVAQWERYLEQFGHRGIYESDIARPRYREQQQQLLQGLAAGTTNNLDSTVKNKTVPIYLRPAVAQLRRVQAARELWRHESMHVYEHLRMRLLTLADRAVHNGQLPTVASLWQLSKSEVSQLDSGAVYSAEFFETRAQEVADNKAIAFPDYFHRFDDLHSEIELDGDLTMLKGISLASGTVTGKAWVLDEPALALPEGFSAETTILVARSIDAGWIPTFGLVAAAVVEIGGDLSHGSILLREVGLPAVTNVRHATRHIQSGQSLRVDASTGVIRL